MVSQSFYIVIILKILSDKCRHSPDGFTYGMPGQGCRSYWLCVNGHSVGSCCATGTYYVEGMGCMRGMACKQPCPPDGGILVTRKNDFFFLIKQEFL